MSSSPVWGESTPEYNLCWPADDLGTLTLKGQHLAAVDHDAELQHQLRSALQKGLEQTQHADICILKHHAAVEVTALGVSMPAALHPQIQGVDIPEGRIQTLLLGEARKKEESFNLQKLLNIKAGFIFETLGAVTSWWLLPLVGFRLD